MEFRLPESIRDEYDAEGRFRLYHGKRRYSSQMYKTMSFKWVTENMRCPDCQGALKARERARDGSHELGNLVCQGCGKEFTFVSSIVPLIARVRMSSYLGLLRAIEEENLPDFILLTYDRDSLDIRYLLYMVGEALTPEFIDPGWRREADDEHDIWCDIASGRLNAVMGEGILFQLYPEQEDSSEK